MSISVSASVHRQPKSTIEDRIINLLERMTFKEKVRPLARYFGAFGKLPISFPRTSGQNPFCYKRRDGQKRYSGDDNRPLYDFRHGLGYTTFRYDSIVLSSASIRPNDNVTVTVGLTNTGDRDGEEVVQLYINDVFCSVARPELELKQFHRIHLMAGESAKVSFTLTPRDLSIMTCELEWVVEPGTFRALVGTSSDNIALIADFIVV